MQLLLATSNYGKSQEMREALSGLSLEILDLKDFSIGELPEETGETFMENAVLKANHYFSRTGIPTVADDSGIIVEALKDELGIHTRRWGAGSEASDAEWIAYFLKRMESEESKWAKFVCALAFIDQDGRQRTFEGSCEGVITPSLEAEYLPGLPLSACFKPDGHTNVFSALSPEEKNLISHRGKALHQFHQHLESMYAQ